MSVLEQGAKRLLYSERVKGDPSHGKQLFGHIVRVAMAPTGEGSMVAASRIRSGEFAIMAPALHNPGYLAHHRSMIKRR